MKKTIKEGIKGFSIIACIYLLLVMFLNFYTWRIERLDQNSYTEEGRAKTIQLFKKGK